MAVYYVCPDCGHKQRSKADKRIRCHNCGRSYQRKKAKTLDSKVKNLKPSEKEKAEFHTYQKSQKENENK